MFKILFNSLIFIALLYVAQGRDCHQRDIEKDSNQYIIPSNCKTLISSLKRIDKPDIFVDTITKSSLKLYSLDLSRNDLDGNSIGRILDWLYTKNRNNIVELKLGGNSISSKDFELLSLIMLDCRNLKHLELQDMNLNEDAARHIYHSIMDAENLEYINLERNLIGKRATKQFAGILHSYKHHSNKKLDIVHKDIYEAYHDIDNNDGHNNNNNDDDDDNGNTRLMKMNAKEVIESVEELLTNCGFPELITSILSIGATDAFKIAELPPSYLERIGLKAEDEYDFGHCICHNFIYGLHMPKLHSNIKAEHHLNRHIPVLCHPHFLALHRKTQKENRKNRVYSKKALEYHRHVVEPRVNADTILISSEGELDIAQKEL